MCQTEKQFFLADCYGFCNGVKHAVTLFHETLEAYGAPVYVLHEVVHNTRVTEDMKTAGAVFVDSIDQVPEGAVLLTGAHGITLETERLLAVRRLTVVDATCPLVKRLHTSVGSCMGGRSFILFGRHDHPETEGIISRASGVPLYLVESPEDTERLPAHLEHPVFLSQTTMNRKDCEKLAHLLKERYPDIEIPGGVCHATQERQTAVERLAEKCRLILVIGSRHSSNANRLCEIARAAGCRTALVESADCLPDDWKSFSRIGITAGASTPETLVNGVIASLEHAGWKRGR